MTRRFAGLGPLIAGLLLSPVLACGDDPSGEDSGVDASIPDDSAIPQPIDSGMDAYTDSATEMDSATLVDSATPMDSGGPDTLIPMDTGADTLLLPDADEGVDASSDADAGPGDAGTIDGGCTTPSLLAVVGSAGYRTPFSSGVPVTREPDIPCAPNEVLTGLALVLDDTNRWVVDGYAQCAPIDDPSNRAWYPGGLTTPMLPVGAASVECGANEVAVGVRGAEWYLDATVYAIRSLGLYCTPVETCALSSAPATPTMLVGNVGGTPTSSLCPSGAMTGLTFQHRTAGSFRDSLNAVDGMCQAVGPSL